MSVPITFSLTAAQQAVARYEEGATPLIGDAELCDLYERWCRQEAERLEDQIGQYEYTVWLAAQCPVCEEGGGGPECDMHVIDHDFTISRLTDI